MARVKLARVVSLLLFTILTVLVVNQPAQSHPNNGKVTVRLLPQGMQVTITDPDGIRAWYIYDVDPKNRMKKGPNRLDFANPVQPACPNQVVINLPRARVLPQPVWVRYFDCEDDMADESWTLPLPVDTTSRDGERVALVAATDSVASATPSQVKETSGSGTEPLSRQVSILLAIAAVTMLLTIYIAVRISKNRNS